MSNKKKGGKDYIFFGNLIFEWCLYENEYMKIYKICGWV
jgi:hypothetical protein